MRRLQGPFAAASMLLCGAAQAATVPAFLYADQGTDEIRLTFDRDGHGTANGRRETLRFFGEGNASGLAAASSNVFTLAQGTGGAVWYGDGGSDAVYRLRDLDGDRTAMGVGEAQVWFSAAGNAGGLSLLTPNGLAEGGDGAIYVVEADTVSTPSGDRVYRTVDLNGDGDAEDPGEARVWLDLKALVPTSAPFEIAFDGDVAYIIDPAGSATDVVWRAEDLDGSGDISASEVTRFIDDDNGFGVPLDFAMDAGGGSVFLWEWLSSDAYSVYRLTDLDGSGLIDAAGETAIVWDSTQLPAGFEVYAGFAVAVGGDGSLLLTSNGSAAGQDNLIRLLDGNGDGDFLDSGETALWLSRALTGDLPDRPRAAAWYAPGGLAPVPLPATAPLLAGALGLAGLGLRRTRRG